MKTQSVAVSKIVVMDGVDRQASRVEDDLLRKSIREGGIQQPLVLVESDGRLLLAKGLRRLRIAQELNIQRVPAVLDPIPRSETPEGYVRKLRFIVDEHRQDLLPTQRAELIEKMKSMFGMNHRQVSTYLGIDQDSVTNWLAVNHYIEPVRVLMDAGRLTMRAARAFDGMTDEGQKAVLKKHERELTGSGGSRVHKEVRALYPPEKFSAYYRDAEKTAARLTRHKGKRKAVPRPSITAADKKRLLNSYDMKEAELRDGQHEQKALKAEINAAIPVIGAIRRSEKLWAMVPEEMQEELERFIEVYV